MVRSDPSLPRARDEVRRHTPRSRPSSRIIQQKEMKRRGGTEACCPVAGAARAPGPPRPRRRAWRARAVQIRQEGRRCFPNMCRCVVPAVFFGYGRN